MCERCDRAVELLKETKGINSGDFTYIEFSFPYGEARLVRAADVIPLSHDRSISAQPGGRSQVPDALSRASGEKR